MRGFQGDIVRAFIFKAAPCAPIAFSMLILSACAMQVQKYPDPTVVRLPAKSRPILVKKIVSQLGRGQEIGSIHIGGLCLRNGTLRWNTGGHVPMLNEELANHLNTELDSAGYDVVRPTESLFEAPNEGNAEFMLGGVVKSLASNRCYPFAGFGNYGTSSGEASVEVEWQLYEKRTRAIVYTATTGGTGKADNGPNGAEDAFYRAVTAALRNLLIDQQFAGRLVRADGQSSM